MDDFPWKILLKMDIQGYPYLTYLRTPPYMAIIMGILWGFYRYEPSTMVMRWGYIVPSGNQTWQANRKSPMKMDVHKWEHHGIFQQAIFEDTGENHHKRLITSLYNVPTNYQSMR